MFQFRSPTEVPSHSFVSVTSTTQPIYTKLVYITKVYILFYNGEDMVYNDM